MARGRAVRQSKLLFYAKMAEKALQTYERDGWGEFPTQINPERREIRPTADRWVEWSVGVDTSVGAGVGGQQNVAAGWWLARSSRVGWPVSRPTLTC